MTVRIVFGASTVEWLTAIGTVGAVIVALCVALFQGFWTWKKRPVLTLSFDPESDLDLIRGVGVGRGRSGHWLRLQVHNKTGKRSAHDAEVLVVELKLGAANSIVHAGRPLDNAPLRWSSLMRDGQPMTHVSIPPGLTRRIDLLGIYPPVATPVVPRGSGDQEEGIAVVQVSPEPSDESHVLHGPDTFAFVLAVASRDLDAHFYDLSVTWDGVMHDATEIKDHLKIVGPTRVRNLKKLN